jgi:hypothetical protein
VVEGAEMDAVLRFVERGIGVAIVPAMVLIDRPGLRAVRLAEPTLTRTISIARTAELQPASAVRVMQQTIARTATSLADRSGATMRLADGGADGAGGRRTRGAGAYADQDAAYTRRSRRATG